MNQKKKPHVSVLRLAAVLMILVLLTTSMVSGRYARYASSDSYSEGARIAAFVFDVEDTDGQAWSLDLTELQKPGDEQTFSFVVTNAKDSDTFSEVAICYGVTVMAEGSVPAEITIEDESKQLLLTVNCDGSASGSFAGADFAAAESASHVYTMTVEWPGAMNGMEFAEGKRILALTVSVKGEQKD